VPSEIGELNNLEYLYLYDNQLTQISPEISRLNKLKIFLDNRDLLYLGPFNLSEGQ